MLFPYRNDPRKTLIPYLRKLDEEYWFKKTAVYPNNLAWIISHIASSEDYWVNEVGLQKDSILTINEDSSIQEILDSYIRIRNYTDDILRRLDTKLLNKIVEVPTFSDGWTPPSEPTFNWLFNHIYTHEAYHIGQIALIAHINGFPKPLF
ncbi:DinB family protein [Viridibacillus sp. YIM B01967]|uniref:DinB family protein n=1 Tax=Viridibacillus soli TaxID=2798301 RepID=A0ABS1HAA4_9BACL|nr:DinB family protein [Viridibacillus soli]MBK3496333.1 DinB family protein [Viridibacillus soli]